MRVTWTPTAKQEYDYWIQSDPKMVEAIQLLIKDIKRSQFEGLGKPEPLKYDLKGLWSRRITREHRLVYRVSGKGPDKTLEIIQCRYHY